MEQLRKGVCRVSQKHVLGSVIYTLITPALGK